MNAAHGGGHGLGLPWLAPIRNSSELRGLCYRSCFGPRTCVRGITNYRNVLGLSIRVSPSHPYNAGSAGLGWGGGRHRENVYAACSDYVGFLALGESATRSLVTGLEGVAQRFIRNASYARTRTRAHVPAHAH